MTILRGGILISLAHLCCLSSAGWLVTRYYEESTTTAVAGFEGLETTIPPYLQTSTVFVTPTVDEPSALATETAADDYRSDLSYVDIQVAPSQGDPVPEHDATNSSSYDENLTNCIVMTFTYAASCMSKAPSPTTTGTAIIDIPTQVLPQVTPTSTYLTSYTAGSPDSDATVMLVTKTRAFFDPSDIPTDVVSSARATATPAFFDNCGDDPNKLPPGCSRYRFIVMDHVVGQGYCCPDGCHNISGLSVAGVVLAVVFSLFGFFLLLGLLQNVNDFRKLMTGQQACRGLPYFFCCLVPGVTCPLLFFTSFGFQARSPEDQAVLQAEWNATPFKTKFLLWLKYGFRYKYPPTLGTPVPARVAGVGRANQEQQQQQQQQDEEGEELPSRPSSPSARRRTRVRRSFVIERLLGRPRPARTPANRSPPTAAPPPPYSDTLPPGYETVVK